MEYIHGYTKRENQRLFEQSQILRELLHRGTSYAPKEKLLEVGCGVGAQTLILCQENPETLITSVDVCAESLDLARARVSDAGCQNVSFAQASVDKLPYPKAEFDHIFVCFVLEHLPAPADVLLELKRVLKPGGTITLIEGDHGSCFWCPWTEASKLVWNCLIQTQTALGHNPLIGRELYPLLETAGFQVSFVKPRWVYADAGNPTLLDGVVNQIIVPMVETAQQSALAQELIDAPGWDKGVADLLESGQPPSGTFFYTWFKAVAVRRE